LTERAVLVGRASENGLLLLDNICARVEKFRQQLLSWFISEGLNPGFAFDEVGDAGWVLHT
jgi:hypothetical protein